MHVTTYVICIVGLLFLRATNFVDFVDFSDFHKICFTKNYWKSYCDMNCTLKRNVDSWKLFPRFSLVDTIYVRNVCPYYSLLHLDHLWLFALVIAVSSVSSGLSCNIFSKGASVNQATIWSHIISFYSFPYSQYSICP